MIAVVDYGMGNLRSVQKAFERLGHAAEICSAPAELERAGKMVLPGVGAFRDAMAELRRRDLVEPICAHVDAGRPFLGICLGLQLLFDVGCEDGQWPGLGIIAGKVVRFDDAPGLKIPHMGWNSLHCSGQPLLMKDIPDTAHFYFVHSYHAVPEDEAVVAARTDHGGRFVSLVTLENVFATQFHPEKSQRAGLRMLKNFALLSEFPCPRD